MIIIALMILIEKKTENYSVKDNTDEVNNNDNTNSGNSNNDIMLILLIIMIIFISLSFQ